MARIDIDEPRERYDAIYWRDFVWRLQEELEQLDETLGDVVIRVAVSANYTADINDMIIAVTDTSSARTITLPGLAKLSKRMYVVDESGGAGTNAITIDVSGSGTIDGLSSINITNDYNSVRVYSDGQGNFFTF